MGRLKHYIGREHMLLDGKVCYSCFSNPDLEKFIKDNGKTKGCDYCGSQCVSHEISEVIDRIHSCLCNEYEDPVESMGWDGREGGYQGASTYNSWEVLSDAEVGIENDRLFDFVASNLPNEIWCEKDPYQLRHHQELMYSWQKFSEFVKYECRYMFLEHGDTEKERTLDRVLVSTILQTLADFFETNGLFKTLPAGTVLKRARKIDSKAPFKLVPAELATPPRGIPKSSRMSPAGIPLFYGAKTKKTALREIGIKAGDYYAIAEFVLKEDISIIDLTDLPEVPTIFSAMPSYDRAQLIFLWDFLNDFSKPIAKDGHEHIDYVPTQIVSEFCRFKVTHNGQPIRGFAYPSSIDTGGISYCLFVSRLECGVHEDQYPPRFKKILECTAPVKRGRQAAQSSFKSKSK